MIRDGTRGVNINRLGQGMIRDGTTGVIIKRLRQGMIRDGTRGLYDRPVQGNHVISHHRTTAGGGVI